MAFPDDFRAFKYQGDLAPGINNYQVTVSETLALVFNMERADGDEPPFPSLWVPRYAVIKWGDLGEEGTYKVVCPDIFNALWQEGPGTSFVHPGVFDLPGKIISCVGERRPR